MKRNKVKVNDTKRETYGRKGVVLDRRRQLKFDSFKKLLNIYFGNFTTRYFTLYFCSKNADERY